LGVKVTLIGIQNDGDFIGPDLNFTIAINGYGQGTSFKQKLTEGGARTDIPVFSQVFSEGFDARLGVTINVVETDTKRDYDDIGTGGGFIDTYIEGLQQVTVYVPTRGGDVGKVAKFDFTFKVELCEYQQEGPVPATTGETTTGGGIIGGTTTGEDDGDDPRDTEPPEDDGDDPRDTPPHRSVMPIFWAQAAPVLTVCTNIR
jgi:hypothetical protein